MDSRAMEVGVYNASRPYVDRIYNNQSGIIAEHSKFLTETQTTTNSSNGNFSIQSQLNGDGAESMVFDGEENYLVENFESVGNDSPGFDVITVDPNCFYSSGDDDDEDEDVIVDDDSDEYETNSERNSRTSANGDESQYPLMAEPIHIGRESQQQKHQPAAQSQPFDDISFDITKVNITDFCGGDENLLTEHDDILFANDAMGSQFDLAKYIAGESSSLLLSPPPAVAAVRHRVPLKSTPAKKNLAAFNGNDARPEEDDPPAQLIVNAQPATEAASNGIRRKRRHLTKAFIDTTDDSDTENEKATIEMHSGGVDAGKMVKKQRRKDDDPAWNPVPTGNPKTNGKAKNDDPATRDPTPPMKSGEVSKDKANDKSKSMSPPSTSTSGHPNGLRTLLKKQLLSNRPMKMNSIKSNSKVSTSKSTNNGSVASSAQAACVAKRTFGVGRGKDISMTAKHFNSAKSSDNSDRDNTDNDSKNVSLDVESSSESESDASIRDAEELNSEKTKTSAGDTIIAAKWNVTEKCREISANAVQVKPTTAAKPPTNVPALKDNVDFAKAIFVDAKEVTKEKPPKRDDFKRSVSEQPSLKRPPLLINIGIKFKTNCLNKPIAANVAGRPFAELRTPNGTLLVPKARSLTDVCARPKTVLPKIPLRRHEAVESNTVGKVADAAADDAKMEIDAPTVDETKCEPTTAAAAASAKKKLNIQEYLKRKNMSAVPEGKAKICREEHSYGKPVEMKPKSAAERDDGHERNGATSMYEEIISVSMGCCTNISIPAVSRGVCTDGADAGDASKSTTLLSNIQTTIEKANSALEQGKISSCSLISSIQDVILKKTTATTNPSADVAESEASVSTGGAKEAAEHGENKVIMHLRKDRIRPTTVTIAIQTEPYFQFPPLERLSSLNRKQEHFDRCKSFGRSVSGNSATAHDVRSMRAFSMQRDRFANRNYRMNKGLSDTSYYSDDDDDQHQMSSPQRRSRHSEYLESIAHPPSNGQFRRRHKRSGSYKNSRKYRSSKFERDSNRHRTISRSLSQSSDSSSSSSTSTSSSSSATSISTASSKSLNSYGDSSTKSYYGDEQYGRRRTRPTQNWPRAHPQQRPNHHRSNSPEERRIVYVGRIENETTKDDLRRIFSVYGRIENVTLHYKEMKYKYGFVTFERPADAYSVIDTGARNPALKNYDISFGGRRAFCRERYLDLDNTEDDYSQSMHPMAKKPKLEDDSFEALLRKVKEKLQETKE